MLRCQSCDLWHHHAAIITKTKSAQLAKDTNQNCYWQESCLLPLPLLLFSFCFGDLDLLLLLDSALQSPPASFLKCFNMVPENISSPLPSILPLTASIKILKFLLGHGFHRHGFQAKCASWVVKATGMQPI